MTYEIEPRTFAEIAEHAHIAREELAIAQGDGYIAGPGYEQRSTDVVRPVLPGFKTRPLSKGSLNLTVQGEHVRWDTFNTVGDHIRFLEHVVERLAAQVAEMAERLATRED